MERSFSEHRYPDVNEREKLSELTGLPEDRIQVNHLTNLFWTEKFKILKIKSEIGKAKNSLIESWIRVFIFWNLNFNL